MEQMMRKIDQREFVMAKVAMRPEPPEVLRAFVPDFMFEPEVSENIRLVAAATYSLQQEKVPIIDLMYRVNILQLWLAFKKTTFEDLGEYRYRIHEGELVGGREIEIPANFVGYASETIATWN